MGEHVLRQALGNGFLVVFPAYTLEGKNKKHSFTRQRSGPAGIHNGGYETIPKPGESFDETGTPRGVSQQIAKFVDGGIQPVFVADYRIGPELFPERSPGYNLSGSLQ